jgi:hypothetical protein
VPVSTEVINANPEGSVSGASQDGALVITVDTRKQNVHQRLGLGTRTQLHFSRENEFFAQELSGLLWPIRYRVLTRDTAADGQRVHFTTQAEGLDARRGASRVLRRAAVLLVVVAGVGDRRASWLLEELFHLEVSKSTRQRWTGEIAASLPRGDEMIRALNARQPITSVAIPSDYFQGMPNVCKKLWKWALDRRPRTQERAEASGTPWYRKKWEALAKSLGQTRYLSFKADARMSEQERAKLAERVEAECHS